MNGLLDRISSVWVRYSKYEWKAAEDGHLYLTPAPKASPDFYDPMEEEEEIALAALRLGNICIEKDIPEETIRAEILAFAEKYGLLGFMTALPTTPQFMDYEAVYLPKNRFIREESMQTEDYLRLFYPFEKLDYIKHGRETTWNVKGDMEMVALTYAMGWRPIAVNMGFQREYAERFDWLKLQFRDWMFMVMGSFFYYHDYDQLNDATKAAMQRSMAAFGGNVPTYHIELLDKPTLIWNFDSLLVTIQMLLSLMLTDTETPLKLCKHCMSPFVASRPSAVFCSPKCKNRYNVYKSRARSSNSRAEKK